MRNKQFSYFSTKTYVVGTQKNRLDETVLLSTTRYVKTDRSEPVVFTYCMYLSHIELNWPAYGAYCICNLDFSVDDLFFNPSFHLLPMDTQTAKGPEENAHLCMLICAGSSEPPLLAYSVLAILCAIRLNGYVK